MLLPTVCLDQLKKHRQHRLKERLRAGVKSCGNELILSTFTRRGPGVRVGAPLHPRNVLLDAVSAT